MADSDNTTSLSFVTRRHVLMGTVAAVTWPFTRKKAAAGVPPTNGDPLDPALVLWRQWREAYRRTSALCGKQQRLERHLINEIGFPRAKVFLQEEDVTVTISWLGYIEELFGDNPAMADLRAQAEADLAAHQARWDEADREVGYSAAKMEEQEAADQEEALVDALMSAPATSLAGIAGKLDAILREGESWEECTDFPWPYIRSALADVVRIGAQFEPGDFMPGSEHKGPYPRRFRDGCCFQIPKNAYAVGS